MAIIICKSFVNFHFVHIAEFPGVQNVPSSIHHLERLALVWHWISVHLGKWKCGWIQSDECGFEKFSEKQMRTVFAVLFIV